MLIIACNQCKWNKDETCDFNYWTKSHNLKLSLIPFLYKVWALLLSRSLICESTQKALSFEAHLMVTLEFSVHHWANQYKKEKMKKGRKEKWGTQEERKGEGR